MESHRRPVRRGRRPKILYLVTEDWYFCSHRLPVARAARDVGYDVVVVTRVGRHGEDILREGFRLIPLSWQRRSLHPWRELRAIMDVAAVYRKEQPDLVHHVALKPTVYGSVAARIAGLPPAVNTIAGLGYVFTSREWKARVLNPVLRGAFRWLTSRDNVRLILQNPEDREVVNGLCHPDPSRLVLIRGSGVDVRRFRPTPEPPNITITMVTRMLWSKGVGDLVKAARILAQEGESIRIVLVGEPDFENPASVPERQLLEWHNEGLIDWRGRQEDIPAVWASSTMAVLPTTYGEGVPKSLIEAAASGRPIIATNTPGCREIVHDGENGLLVPVNDPAAIARAIVTLAHDPDRRLAMGEQGRRLVVDQFSEDVVVRQTLDVYRSLSRRKDGR